MEKLPARSAFRKRRRGCACGAGSKGFDTCSGRVENDEGSLAHHPCETERADVNIGSSGPWNRIPATRRAGNSLDLPATDPRRPVSPVLLGLLLVAVVVA